MASGRGSVHAGLRDRVRRGWPAARQHRPQMTCPECGITGMQLGRSATKAIWKCPRGHVWEVSMTIGDVSKPTDPARAAAHTAERLDDLFSQVLDAKPAPRHHPPEDTEAASAAAAQASLGGIRRELLQLASRIEGVTGDEAVAALDMDDRQTSVRPALSQLVKMGMLYKSRMRRVNRRGFSEIVYRTNGELAC